jgi:hypothetical protein
MHTCLKGAGLAPEFQCQDFILQCFSTTQLEEEEPLLPGQELRFRVCCCCSNIFADQLYRSLPDHAQSQIEQDTIPNNESNHHNNVEPYMHMSN